jgi:hypothetical protein
MTQIEKDITIFFQDPRDFASQQGIKSTLYLLRRDTCQCFGFDPNSYKKIEFQALWPAVMGVMAGIDLLAKFMCGDEIGVGVRLRNYVIKYIDENISEELYQLRNSLMHSFGLYSENRKNIYHFVLGNSLKCILKEKIINHEKIIDGILIQKKESVYFIDIFELWEKFEESIKDFHFELNSSIELKNTFNKMFHKYGLIGIVERRL